MTTNTKIIIAFILGAIFLYIAIAIYNNQTKPQVMITSYEECVAAGYPIMESYPEQCAVPGGPTFTREIDESPIDDTDPIAKQVILLYYYDQERDTDATGNIKCSADGLVAVERTIPVSMSPMQDAIRLLLTGNLTPAEKANGITTEFPLPGLTLEGVTVDNDGVLVLNFDDPESATTGGSCRTNILWQQIQATATQFDTIDEVRFAPLDLFQP